MSSEKAVDYEKCVFCRIAHNMEQNTRILTEKEDVVVFEDIKPAAKHHYLVIPKTHMKDPKHLGPEHIQLVETLLEVGKEYLSSVGGDVDAARFGFHWPPFNAISHLHLHVISPAHPMGFVSSLIFRPNSFWFVTVDWLLVRLRKMKSSSV